VGRTLNLHISADLHRYDFRFFIGGGLPFFLCCGLDTTLITSAGRSGSAVYPVRNRRRLVKLNSSHISSSRQPYISLSVKRALR